MTGEALDGSGEERQLPDGIRWLQLIGRGDLADEDLVLRDGTTIKGADFPEKCREHAIDVFMGIEELDAEDPDREEEIDAARAMFDGHFGTHITE